MNRIRIVISCKQGAVPEAMAEAVRLRIAQITSDILGTSDNPITKSDVDLHIADWVKLDTTMSFCAEVTGDLALDFGTEIDFAILIFVPISMDRLIRFDQTAAKIAHFLRGVMQEADPSFTDMPVGRVVVAFSNTSVAGIS